MIRTIAVALWSVSSLCAQQDAWTDEEVRLRDGSTLRVSVVRPADFDRSKAYPVLLALPPGKQDAAMVEAGMRRYWGAQARDRGWVVVSPVAPTKGRFFEGGESTIGGLLRWVRIQFTIEGNGIHLAGASNGGRSAFRIAMLHPWEFRSLSVLPGYPPTDADYARLAELRRLDVHMFVGGDDGKWVTETERSAARLRALGASVKTRVFDGEGHVPPSLDGTAMIEHLQSLRPKPSDDRTRAVDAVLDDWHDAAAKADEDRYFGLFAENAVFMGTDATERWSVAQLRSYGERAFARDSAWIFVPTARFWNFAADGNTAWFDEELGNASFGDCRGSGVVVRTDEGWRVAHYNLTVPIPNDLVYGVVDRIRRAKDPDAGTRAITIYMVRHAEKQGGDDPPLTDSGQARAVRLAAMLRSADIDRVYTTATKRTRATAAPTAKRAGAEVREYDGMDAAGFAQRLRADELGNNVLVVGHSNTLPMLLDKLGIAGQEIAHECYDKLFVVQIDADGVAKLDMLRF